TSRNSFMFFWLSSTTRMRSPAMAPPFGRQCEDEAAAVAGLALDPDPTAVQLDEPLREREPEPGAIALLEADLGLLELLEDPLVILGRDSRSGVRHGHERLAVHPRGLDADVPARRRELHRVREQVEDHLAQPAFVAVDQVDIRSQLERDAHAALGRPLADHHDTAFE